MPRHLVASLCVVLSAGGCDCGSSSDPGHVDEATRALLEAAGEDALVTVIARPNRWTVFRDAFVPLLPGRIGELVRAAPDPWSLLPALFDTDISALPSLDRQRAFAVGLLVPATPDLLESVRQLTANGATGVAGLRHRVILPANDAPRLAGEIAALLGRFGVSILGAGDIHGSSFVALYAEGDHVRVEVVSDDTPGPSQWYETWKATLARTPRARLADAAGVQHVLSSDAFAAVYVQSARLRATHAAVGATKVAQALASVEPTQANLLLNVGSAEILSGWSLLAPERALVHDVGLALDGEGGVLVLRAVAGLTARGRALFAHARESATPAVIPNAASGPLARMSLALSVASLFERLELPPTIADAKEEALARTVLECGAFCRLSLAGMLATLKRLMQLQPPESRAALPRSAAFTASRSSGSPGDPGTAFAVGFAYENGRLPSAAIEQVRANLPRGWEIETRPEDKGELALAGFGMSPRAAFEVGADGPLMSLSVDMDWLGGTLDGLISLPPKLGALVGHSELSGPALVTVFALGPQAVAPPLADYSDFKAAATREPSAGSVCLERAVAAVAEGWSGAGRVAPDERALIRARSLADSEVALRCAEADPDTQAAAAILRSLSQRP